MLGAKLEVKSDLNNWNKVEIFIKRFIDKYNLDKSILYKTILSCEEIFVNICSYAYKKNVGNVVIEIDINNNKFIKITLIDEGIEFDPTKFKNENINYRIKNRMPGGLGILLAKKNMDMIEYKRFENKNILTMIKNLGSDKFE